MDNRWGLELVGSPAAKEMWRVHLKPPFLPFLEQVNDKGLDFLIMRAAEFDGIATSAEVLELGKCLLRRLNVVMAEATGAYPLGNGAVVEFPLQGPPQRYYFVEGTVFRNQNRFGGAKIVAMDAQGNVVDSPLLPSKAQRWMHAVRANPKLRSAIGCLDGNPGWVEYYKIYEALKTFTALGIPKSEIERLRRTANAYRHLETQSLPKVPMTLAEARDFVGRWLEAAVARVLAKDQE